MRLHLATTDRPLYLREVQDDNGDTLHHIRDADGTVWGTIDHEPWRSPEHGLLAVNTHGDVHRFDVQAFDAACEWIGQAIPSIR